MKKIPKPHFTEHTLYYEQYLNLVNEEVSVLEQLKQNAKRITQLYKSLPQEKLLYAYAEGKWTMKDILQHLTDVERVFTYRAMRFARKDKTPLPFFDENEFARNAMADRISITKLLKEYNATRNATVAFFNNLTAKQLKETGFASQTLTSVRACLWIICAHEVHHLNIIKERYLNA